MLNFPSIIHEFDRATRDERLFGWPTSLLREVSKDEHLGGAFYSPTVDVEETNEAYLLSFDVPGLSKESLGIEFADGQLVISGERKVERSAESKRHVTERVHGTFKRTLKFGENIEADKIEAKLDQGVLYVTLPKAETVKPKKIAVQ
jgi:HSP20 family protein